MSAPPAAPITSNFPGGPAPTRVLADLGRSASPQRSRAAVAALVSGVIAVAAGGIYWASTLNGNGTLAVSQTSPATHAAPTLSALAPSGALLTQHTPSAAPTATPEPVAASARIVTDDSPASTMAAPAAGAPVVATAAAAVAVASVESPAASPKATRAARVTATNAPRAAAAGNARREQIRTASARPTSGKPTALAAKKTRSGNQRVDDNTSAKKLAVAKRPDPDTDLLAALLRRNEGQTQAAIAPKDRVR